MSRLPEPPAEPVPPRRSPPEIGAFLVLSTAHIPLETALLLNRWAELAAAAQPLVVASTSYGWFLSAAAVKGRAAQAIPTEIAGIQRFARSLGCHYILLDCDGEEVEELPTFSW